MTDLGALAAQAAGAPLEALGELGVLCAPVGPELGGPGAGWTGHVAVLEALARADPAHAAGVAAHVAAAVVLAEHAATDQARRLVPGLAQGHERAALLLDEGHTGLDADAVTTVARDGALHGAKVAPREAAHVHVTIARDGDGASAFVLRRDGVRRDGDRLVLDGAPAERVGAPGAGLRIALRAADQERLAAAAIATGEAAAALDALPLELPDAGDRVAAARALTARAARLKDLGLPHAVEGATAQRLARALADELARLV